MEIIVKHPETPLYDEKRHEEPAKDSQTLRNDQLVLQKELREMIKAGNGEGIVRVRGLLKKLPDLITATEINELRESIDNCTARLAEIKQEAEYAEQIRADKNKFLAEKLKAAEEAGLAVNRVELVLYQLDNEAENLREARREYSNRLNNFIEGAELLLEVN